MIFRNYLFVIAVCIVLIFPSFGICADKKETDPQKIISIMNKELSRSTNKLKAENFESSYFISYLMRDIEDFSVSGKYGAINSNFADRKRNLDIDIRVGNYDFDSSNPATEDAIWDPDSNHYEIYNYLEAPLDNNEDALRNALWLLSDFQYKEALSMYLKKKGKKIFEVDKKILISDFSKEKAYVFFDKEENFLIPKDEWADIVRKESQEFKKYREIYDSEISIEAKKISKYFINSEGSEIFTQEPFISLGISAKTRAEDGMSLDNSKYFYFRNPSQFLNREKLREEIKKIISDLLLLRKSETIDPYTGPAILSPQATGVFFHEAIGHRLEGERQKSEKEGQTFKGRIGEKIIPVFLTVEDDPTLQDFRGIPLNGYYKFDEEGIPSRKVTLIENGILKNFLLSRTPIEGFSNSNGHGRSSSNHNPMARMGNLIVRSNKTVSNEELKKLLIEEAKKQNKPFGLIIRDVEGGDTSTQKRDFQAFRNIPKLVYKVDVNTGKETLVRGVEMIGTPLISIDKIIATADDYEVFNG